MRVRTHLTDKFDLSCPIIQAPMAGGGDTAELVAAVCNSGALGFIGAAYLTPEQIVERGKGVRALTSRLFGINLFAPLPAPTIADEEVTKAIDAVRRYYEELGMPAPATPKLPASRFEDQLAACLDTDAAVFSFAFGLLPPHAVEEVKRRKRFLIGTATTVKEATALAESGVDAVIAQGSEAGGHRSTFGVPFESAMIGTIALVPQVVDAVRMPVIASGGIMDGRGIAAALVLGADAAQMGTAFLTCAEAGVPAAYKDAILGASEDETSITRAFSGRPARGIANRVLRDYENNTASILPFPLQNAVTRPLRTEAARQNRADYLSLWAGQGVRMARRASASELIAQLRNEIAAALQRDMARHIEMT